MSDSEESAADRDSGDFLDEPPLSLGLLLEPAVADRRSPDLETAPAATEADAEAEEATERRPLHAYFGRFDRLCRVVGSAGSQLGRAYAAMQRALDTEGAWSSSASSSSLSGVVVVAEVSLTAAPPAAAAAATGPEAWLKSWQADSMEAVESLRLSPRLLVFGCPGSGKSSLINQLLGEDVLPVGCSLICQSGLLHLHHSEAPFVRLTGAGRPEARQLLTDRPLAGQIQRYLQQDTDEAARLAWASLDGCVLEVGANCNLLRTRLAFVEVPGDCVDHRVRERLLYELSRSCHHTVLYVIDSQKGFCNQDREFLLFLRANRPEIRVIYAANKVDYDPMAELMDRGSDVDDSNDDEDDDIEAEEDATSVHESGQRTQIRKLRLVEDQLHRYRLTYGGDCLFPMSLLRLRLPLRGPRRLVEPLNRLYGEQFRMMEAALAANLKENGSFGVDAAICALFLKAAFAFDAFARDAKEEAGQSKQLQTRLTKDLIRKSLAGTRDEIDRLKQKFKADLSRVHQEREEAIVDECKQLEFGPLRLHQRVRNNEVEQQYRTQINNCVLHLLNSEVLHCLEGTLVQLRADLAEIIAGLQLSFTKETSGYEAADSQWNDVVRMQAREAQTIVAKMQLSIEWESGVNFFTWVRRLVAKKNQSVAFSSPEWKASVAREFYDQISLGAVVKKIFAELDAKLHQIEQRLLSLLTARRRCGARLRQLLRKGQPDACEAWLAAQLSLATADALRTAQRLGPLEVGGDSADGVDCRLGRQWRLRADYGDLTAGLHGVTVLHAFAAAARRRRHQPGRPAGDGGWASGAVGGVCGLYLARSAALRCHLSDQLVAPLLVTLSTDYQLCVLHNAYTHSFEGAIGGGFNYNGRQAFMLLASLLRLRERLMAEGLSLQSANIRVRFGPDEATALYDCLDEPLQVTKPSSHGGGGGAGGGGSREFKRTRSQDVLAASEKAERRELETYLRLAFMVLCRGLLVQQAAGLLDCPAATLGDGGGGGAGCQQQQRLTVLLQDAAKHLEPSRFVIPRPWEAIAELHFCATDCGGLVAGISNFIGDGMRQFPAHGSQG